MRTQREQPFDVKVAEETRAQFGLLRDQIEGRTKPPGPWGWTLGSLVDEIERGLTYLGQEVRGNTDREEELRVETEEARGALFDLAERIAAEIDAKIDLKLEGRDLSDAILDAVRDRWDARGVENVGPLDTMSRERDRLADRVRELEQAQVAPPAAPVPPPAPLIPPPVELPNPVCSVCALTIEGLRVEPGSSWIGKIAHLACMPTTAAATPAAPAPRKSRKRAQPEAAPQAPVSPGQIRVDRQALTEALQIAAKVSPALTSALTMPILACARLSSPALGRLEIHATDIDAHLRIDLPVEGAFQVPRLVETRALLAEVKAAAKTERTIVLTADMAPDRLRVGDIPLPIAPLPPEDYPVWPPFGAAQTRCAIGDTVALQAALAYVMPAASRDVIRRDLGGVYFDEGRLVTTDGHRAHLAALPGACVLDRAAVPTVALGVLDAALDRLKPGLVEFLPAAGSPQAPRRDSDAPALFSWRFGATSAGMHVELVTRFLDSQFPAFENVLREPRQYEHKHTVNARALAEALTDARRVQMRACDNSLITLQFGATGILVATGGPDVSFEVLVPAVPYGLEEGGEDIRVGVNATYLIDALRPATDAGEEVELHYLDGLSPLWLRNGRFSALVMSVRV